MKKIIFFAYDLGLGGIETALINLLNNIDYTKYDVTLVLEKKKGMFLNEVNKNVHIKKYHIFSCKIVPLRKILNLTRRCIWATFNKNKYDFSCAYATYSMMGCKLSKIASANSSIYIHGDYANMYSKNDLIYFFNKRGINDFKNIFFVSNEAKDNLIKYFPSILKKSIVANNFIDSKKILELASKSTIKKNHKVLFVYVGRLDEEAKRISKMLKLIKSLKEKFSLELWLVGDGKDANIYKEYIEDNNLTNNIKMLGAQKNPYPYIKQADYILMTSEYEGFPVTYLEAATLGKKIITTLDRSDESITISKTIGHIISKNEKQMTKEVEKILNNDELKYQTINLEKLQNERMKMLEKIFDGDDDEEI